MAPRAVLLAFVLAGLFLMHGLGDHGSAHKGSHDALAVSAKISMSHGPQSARSDAPPKAHAGESPAGLPAEESSAAALLGVCLAVLAGVMVGLLFLGGMRNALLHRLRPWLRLGTVPLAALRDRDPPCLFALSIQRC